MNDLTPPPALNLKCIVITAYLALTYWFLPPRNKYILLCLAYFPYLILAWYDWIYACQHNFGPTYLAHFYSWAKPQNSRQIQIYKNWAPSIKRKVVAVDLIVAIAILCLIPMFVNWKPKKMSPKEEEKAKIGSVYLLGSGIIGLLFLRYFKKI